MECNALWEREIVANLGSSDLCNIEGKRSLCEWVTTWDSDKCEMIEYQQHFYKRPWKSIFFGDSYTRRTCVRVFLLGPLQYMPERKFPTLGKHPRKNLHTQRISFPTSIPPFRNTAHIQAIGILSYLLEAKKAKSGDERETLRLC